MRLLLNQIKKDLLRLWPAYALWALALAIRAATPPSGESEGLLQSYFSLALWLIPFFLTALTLQLDPLAEDSAFWVTRPIPRFTLLLGKATLIGSMLVLLPVAFQMVLLRQHGLGVDRLGLALADALTAQITLVGKAAFLAVLTRNLPTFSLAAAAGFLLQFSLHWIRIDTGEMDSLDWSGLTAARAVLGALVCLVFAPAVAALQCYRRRLRDTVLLAAAGFFCLALVYRHATPATWFAIRPWLGGTGVSLSDLKVVAGPPDPADANQEEPEVPGDWINVFGTLSVEGLPDDVFLRLRRVDFEVSDPEGAPFSCRFSTSLDVGDLIPSQFKPLQVAESPLKVRFLEMARLRSGFLRWRATPLSYRARLEFASGRIRHLGTLALREGERLRSDSYDIVLETLQRRGKRYTMGLRSRSIHVSFENETTIQLLLVNEARGEAIWAAPKSISSTGSGGAFVGFIAGGTSFRSDAMEAEIFWPSFDPRSERRLDFGDDWLEGAKLVLIESQLLDRLDGTTKIDDFKISDFRLRGIASKRTGCAAIH